MPASRGKSRIEGSARTTPGHAGTKNTGCASSQSSGRTANKSSAQNSAKSTSKDDWPEPSDEDHSAADVSMNSKSDSMSDRPTASKTKNAAISNGTQKNVNRADERGPKKPAKPLWADPSSEGSSDEPRLACGSTKANGKKVGAAPSGSAARHRASQRRKQDCSESDLSDDGVGRTARHREPKAGRDTHTRKAADAPGRPDRRRSADVRVRAEKKGGESAGAQRKGRSQQGGRGAARPLGSTLGSGSSSSGSGEASDSVGGNESESVDGNESDVECDSEGDGSGAQGRDKRGEASKRRGDERVRTKKVLSGQAKHASKQGTAKELASGRAKHAAEEGLRREKSRALAETRKSEPAAQAESAAPVAFGRRKAPPPSKTASRGPVKQHGASAVTSEDEEVGSEEAGEGCARRGGARHGAQHGACHASAHGTAVRASDSHAPHVPTRAEHGTKGAKETADTRAGAVPAAVVAAAAEAAAAAVEPIAAPSAKPHKRTYIGRVPAGRGDDELDGASTIAGKWVHVPEGASLSGLVRHAGPTGHKKEIGEWDVEDGVQSSEESSDASACNTSDSSVGLSRPRAVYGGGVGDGGAACARGMSHGTGRGTARGAARGADLEMDDVSPTLRRGGAFGGGAYGGGAGAARACAPVAAVDTRTLGLEW